MSEDFPTPDWPKKIFVLSVKSFFSEKALNYLVEKLQTELYVISERVVIIKK